MKLILFVVTLGAVAILFGNVKAGEYPLGSGSPTSECFSDLITENGRHKQASEDANHYPYYAIVLEYGVVVCGGSILNERWILTAAHCLIDNSTNYQVRTGTRYATGGTLTDVSVRITHNNFTSNLVENKFDYDFGMLGLKDLLTFDANTQPVKMPEHGQYSFTTGRVDEFGFGINKCNGIVGELQKAELNFLSTDACKRVSPNSGITSNQFCIARCTECTGLGDVGGPVIIPGTNEQLGVVSGGRYHSDPPNIVVISYVAAVKLWIDTQIVFCRRF